MTAALPPAIAKLIMLYGSSCRERNGHVNKTRVALEAAISEALEESRKAGIVIQRVERVPFQFDEDGDHD